jgi:hypothetical protein
MMKTVFCPLILLQRNKWEKSMLQIALGVIAGFFAWMIVWVGSEKLLSVIWPEGFGAHQRAFQAAIENGGQFTAATMLLLIHIVLGLTVSAMAGFLAALIAGENMRAPLVLGLLLLALGILKAVLSWLPFGITLSLRRFWFQ